MKRTETNMDKKTGKRIITTTGDDDDDDDDADDGDGDDDDFFSDRTNSAPNRIEACKVKLTYKHFFCQHGQGPLPPFCQRGQGPLPLFVISMAKGRYQ